MTQGNRFCTSCGAALAPSDRFCASCGKPLTSAAPVPPAPVPPAPVYAPAPPPVFAPPPAPVYYAPPPPAANIESVIGFIPAVSRKKNMIANEGFTVIVTSRRMIFAEATNALMTEEAKKAYKKEGFFAGLIDSATIGYDFYKRYQNMPPDAALAESPQNFAIELSQIRRVQIEGGKEIENYYTMKANQNSFLKEHQYEAGTISIETIAGNYVFNLPNSSYNMAAETLRKAGLY
jgi:hypothetical protein